MTKPNFKLENRMKEFQERQKAQETPRPSEDPEPYGMQGPADTESQDEGPDKKESYKRIQVLLSQKDFQTVRKLSYETGISQSRLFLDALKEKYQKEFEES